MSFDRNQGIVQLTRILERFQKIRSLATIYFTQPDVSSKRCSRPRDLRVVRDYSYRAVLVFPNRKRPVRRCRRVARNTTKGHDEHSRDVHPSGSSSLSSRKKEHHLYVIVNTYNKPLQKRHVKSLSESNRVARAQRKKKTEERKTDDDISLSFSFVRKNNGLLALLLFPRTDTTKSLSLFGGNNCVEGITRKKIIEKREKKRRKKKKEGVFEIQTLNTQRWSLGFVSCKYVFLL